MVYGSVVRPRLVEAAIELFGDKGFNGVAMSELASFAHTTGATVYRLFSHKKEKVYSVAVHEAIHRALEAAEKSVSFWLKTRGETDEAFRCGKALRMWYECLGKKEARLLQQVLLGDRKHRKLARTPLDKMSDHLAKALEQTSAKTRHTAEALRELAETEVDALFQIKVSHIDDSLERVERRVDTFLKVLFPK